MAVYTLSMVSTGGRLHGNEILKRYDVRPIIPVLDAMGQSTSLLITTQLRSILERNGEKAIWKSPETGWCITLTALRLDPAWDLVFRKFPRTCVAESLGYYCTIFQGDVFPILYCASRSLSSTWATRKS